MPLVTLPSGAVAPLETPGLPALLSCGGSTQALAALAFAHEELDVTALTAEDLFAVAQWGLHTFCGTDDALSLAIVCDGLEHPSRRLRIMHPVLAWTCDLGCAETLARARKELPRASADDEDEPRPGVISYSVPDTWTGDPDE